MSDMDRMQQEIAENERWLAEVCPRSAPLDTARIRQGIEIALQEQWLARTDFVPMGSAAVDRVKDAVRRELAASSRKRRPWTWLAGSFSAAAMIAVAVFTAKAPVEPQVGDVATISLVAAFGTLDEWDNALDTEISSLRDALSVTAVADENYTWDADWESWGEDGSSGT